MEGRRAMENDDTRRFSLEEIKQMRGQTRATPADAPEIELDEDFWRNAMIVETGAPPSDRGKR
jgi:hypothetical protein